MVKTGDFAAPAREAFFVIAERSKIVSLRQPRTLGKRLRIDREKAPL